MKKRKVRKVRSRREVKKSFREEFREKRSTVIAVITILIVAIIAYMIWFYTGVCGNFLCFEKAMSSCSRATYINEEAEATWGYNIIGRSGADCVVEVKLLYAKQGSLNIDELEGYTMDCYYPSGVGTYPEKDLSKCHGRLKEELQRIIIEKLHTYVISNLEEVKEGLLKAI